MVRKRYGNDKIKSNIGVQGVFVRVPVCVCLSGCGNTCAYVCVYACVHKHMLVRVCRCNFTSFLFVVYNSTFTNMYHSMTQRKTKTIMKLVCLLPDERVVGVS